MSQGETNCPFLMFTTRSLSAAARSGRSGGRETRDLQDVGDLGHGGHIVGLVHVGEDWDVYCFFTFAECAAPLSGQAAKTLQRSPIRLVVGRFEDKRDVQRTSYPFDDFRHANGMLFAFDDAGPAIRKRVPEPMRTLSSWKLMAMKFQVSSFRFQVTGAITTLCVLAPLET